MPTINEEAGLPENWHPVDAAPIIPGKMPTGSPSPQGSGPSPYFIGSIPSTFQHDANFVKNAYQSPGVAVTPLMPLANSPVINAGTQTIIKASSTVEVASAAGLDTDVQVNSGGAFYGDSGFTYNKTTQNVFMGGSLSVAANGLISGNLGVGTFVNVGVGFQVAGAATTGHYLRGNGTNFISAVLSGSDILAGKVGLAYGGTNSDLSGTGGSSQVLRQSSSGAAITVSQLSITDISGGIGVVAHSNLTAQSAAITATTIYAISASGFYRINWSATITTAASVSSSLGGTNSFQVIYTDKNDSVIKTTSPTTTVVSAGNTTGTAIAGCINAYCKASTNLQYSFDYISSGVAMVYDLNIYVEFIGA